jgi:hypothetical protein
MDKVRVRVRVTADGREPIPGIRALCRESIKIEKGLRDLVKTAREQGHSWTEIGRAMGITKQAALRRFTEGPIHI